MKGTESVDGREVMKGEGKSTEKRGSLQRRGNAVTRDEVHISE